MESRFDDLPRRFDPDKWEFRVRRADGRWLSRPIGEGRSDGDAAEWTRAIPNGWSFDSVDEARDAATAHGLTTNDFAVIPAPRVPAIRNTQNLQRKAVA